MRELPDLHKQAKLFKNKKRLQHDGGRAWIKDSQLHEAIKGANYRLVTVKPKSMVERDQESGTVDKEAGKIVQATDSGKTF